MFIECMPYLADRCSFWHDQLTVFPCFRFKEKANFITRVQKISAHPVFCFSLTIKDGCALWSMLEIINQTINFVNSLLTDLRSDEARNYCITVLFELLTSLEEMLCDLSCHIKNTNTKEEQSPLISEAIIQKNRIMKLICHWYSKA